MTYLVTVFLPLALAFILTIILAKVLIPVLTRLKVGNTEREVLESHQVKNGTPTMGGLIFLVAIIVTGLLFGGKYPHIMPVLVLTAGFGVIGFIDDYLKVVLRRSDGLLAWQKFLLQVVVTTLFYVYIRFYTDVTLELRIPFLSEEMVSIGVLALPLLYFAVIGTVNGVNFTDGLDGLASTVTVIVSGFFLVASFLVDGGIEPLCAAVCGALLGFLLFNCYPAKVFMGDTGSLALGGFVAGAAYIMNMPLFIIIVGLIYLVEVISVILQVGYFKMTHGKRIFRMAPIHHHFELGGWSEVKVVTVFSVITAVLCVLGICAL